MKSLKIALIILFSFSLRAAEKPLKLDEVLSVIGTNMTDMSEIELGNSAARGLIKELGTKVQFINEGGTNSGAGTEFPDAISKTRVFEDKFGYIRVKSVDARLSSDFHQRLTQLLSSNKLDGLVIDLRYAQGTNYEAAAAVADEFVRAGEPLVKLGERQLTGQDRASDIRKPVAVLVNSETRAAAEALAAILRESAAALVIGSKTAGEARLYEVFTLSTGQKLRVGKVPVVVGRNKTIPATGIVPDIKVEVNPPDERAFYQDPFRDRQIFTTQGSTNEVSSFTQERPTSEAELVRRHRNGTDETEPELLVRRAVPEVAVVTDPALARALDFLKGISIWQPRR